MGRLKKKVRQLDYYTGEVIKTYESMSEAARDHWMEHTVISKALNHKNGIMKHRKLRFEYVD